jgi:hypothetical protein
MDTAHAFQSSYQHDSSEKSFQNSLEDPFEDALREAEQMLDVIMRSGVSEAALLEQVAMFKQGLPFIHLERACTIGDGIVRIAATDEARLLTCADEAQAAGRVMKFVPASGAATRMFKSLAAMLAWPQFTLAELEQAASKGNADAAFTAKFVRNIERFAFAAQLVSLTHAKGLSLASMLAGGDCRPLVELTLHPDGLDFERLPKGLIPFHRYAAASHSQSSHSQGFHSENQAPHEAATEQTRTPFEEQIVEALAYTYDAEGVARIHFTISPEHRAGFVAELARVRPTYERGHAKLYVEFSEQKRSTDTIAVTPQNELFVTGDELHFRPAGHGALLENLSDCAAAGADIVCIKNIDNVVPDWLKAETIRAKRLLCGLAAELQERVFAALEALERGANESELQQIQQFAHKQLGISPTRDWSAFTPDELGEYLIAQLNRPLRVCGMVVNTGEPGGGPFWVREDDGSVSLQIVESAQVNMSDATQASIFKTSTHFNPVDVVCAVRDYKGEPFDLLKFRNLNTGFITVKSKEGRDLKALELPGLWNGSMAHWNTVFVEVPASTFHPVKTVNDLLKPEHQPPQE